MNRNGPRILLPQGSPLAAQERDQQLVGKFLETLIPAVNAFNVRYEKSMHAVLVALATCGVRAGHACGMTRSAWVQFAGEVWDHEQRGDFGRKG